MNQPQKNKISNNQENYQQYYCGSEQPVQQQFLSHHRSLQHNFVFSQAKQIAQYKPRSLERNLHKKSLKKINSIGLQHRQSQSGQLRISDYHHFKQNLRNCHSKAQASIAHHSEREDPHEGNANKRKTDVNELNLKNGGILRKKGSGNDRKSFVFPPPIHHEPLPISPFKNVNENMYAHYRQTTNDISSQSQMMIQVSQQQVQKQNHVSLPLVKVFHKSSLWKQIKQSIIIEDNRFSITNILEDKICDLPDLPEASIFANFRQSFVESAPNKQVLQSIIKIDTFNSEVFSEQLSKCRSTHERIQSIHNFIPKDYLFEEPQKIKNDSCKKKLNFKKSLKEINAAKQILSKQRIETGNHLLSEALQRLKNSAKYNSRIFGLDVNKPIVTTQRLIEDSDMCACSKQIIEMIEGEDRN